MQERKDVVTMKGAALTLVGDEVELGQAAPEVELVANDMSKVKLSSFCGKVCIVSCVPSLDTQVCDVMTRRFNVEAGAMGENIMVLTISMDLPFAQKRWCGAAGVENIQTLSDYQKAEFGSRFGVLIKELHLLARAVFVLDAQGVIRYIQIVKEIIDEPDYDSVLAAAKQLL